MRASQGAPGVPHAVFMITSPAASSAKILLKPGTTAKSRRAVCKESCRPGRGEDSNARSSPKSMAAVTEIGDLDSRSVAFLLEQNILLWVRAQDGGKRETIGGVNESDSHLGGGRER